MTGTIVEVTIPAEQFALEHTLGELETVTLEIKQMVATNRDSLMPFAWIETDERTAIEEALTNDESVADFQLIAELDTECLYQLEWVARIDHLIRILVEENGTVLAATGQDDTWHLRLLFADHDAVRNTTEYCENNGLDFTVNNILEFNTDHRNRFDLTETQQRALQLAAERGYYSVPRDSTADDLAEELGITHQALSERLRRAHGNLVDQVFVESTGTREPPELTTGESGEDTMAE
ncbi:helix-turn-helix domain-containing protein [Haladaptatus caseinilyticus]|uniref:helix-turn-helix domain-containing protein n=1 Tax=Haladaptatus caseinilyticus TaxID=2993314 RepID=UPI00224B796C|nr:helix-turn-helix domain-containing protein [Haladaptatus caseinilyticus]